MKQVININFQGSIIPIEVSAYEILKNYIASLTAHFNAEEGRDEIINDIESRIAELFQIRLKAGATCIEDADVQAVMNSIGRPEDLAGETEDTTANKSSEQKNTKTNTTYNAAGKRRLFRDENHKLVGGVCSGVANYFDIDIAIVRVVFLILLFSFGIGFIPYIILWIAVPSSAEQVIGSRRKKLYRDVDEKYVGGVASGIANYFGINVWIPRVFFLLPAITLFSRNHWGNFGGFDDFDVVNLSPSPLFIYIILWIVLPEARTTAEKLEMKGEKVDMNSIKESVVEEMKGVQHRVQKFGKEVTAVAGEKGKVFGTEAAAVGRRSGNVFADIITIIVKVFVFGILGIVGFSLIISLFGGGILAIKYFSLKDFMVRDGWQNIFTWGILIFFILSPIVGIITWIIRKITKVKAGSKMLRLSFIAMWILGWASLSFLGASLGKDFKYNANINEQNIRLDKPNVKSLEITNQQSGVRFLKNRINNRNVFDNIIDEDSLAIKQVSVQIVKSLTDSFKVTTIKLASCSTRNDADKLASNINFNAYQQDSLLIIDDGITINKIDKFRNQRVIVTVYVPIGKRIKINGHVGSLRTIKFNGPFSINNSYDEFDNISFNTETGWDTGEWYTMTKDGLVSDNAKDAAENNEEDGIKINKNGIDINDGDKKIKIDENGIKIDEGKNEPGGTYRYDKADSKLEMKKMELEKAQKKFNDSIQKEKDKIDKQNENGIKSETAYLINAMPVNLMTKFF
jgi:phage shock protein PspC (stress-responsive transcriptional regulator)